MVIYGLLGITGNQHIHMYIYDEMLDKMQRTDLDIFKPLSLKLYISWSVLPLSFHNDTDEFITRAYSTLGLE